MHWSATAAGQRRCALLCCCLLCAFVFWSFVFFCFCCCECQNELAGYHRTFSSDQRRDCSVGGRGVRPSRRKRDTYSDRRCAGRGCRGCCSSLFLSLFLFCRCRRFVV